MGKTLFIGNNFILLPTVSSTNTYAQTQLKMHPPEGTVYCCFNQTAGRGQGSNSWHTAPGKNLAVSIILYPSFLDTASIFYISKITSLAVQACVSVFLPDQKVEVKWPNDILVNRKKIAGILIENHLDSSGLRASIIGIGLNINQTFFPPEIKDRATSLRHFMSSDLELEGVYTTLFQQMEQYYLQLRGGKRANIDQAYLNTLYGYQEEMDFMIDEKLHKGILVGVQASGKLAVQLGSKLRYFDLKEIGFVW